MRSGFGGPVGRLLNVGEGEGVILVVAPFGGGVLILDRGVEKRLHSSLINDYKGRRYSSRLKLSVG